MLKETDERKMSYGVKIADVQPIDGADAIEAVRVNGWWVVAKKGEFEVGDVAIYLEIDSWVPTEVAPFLSKGKEPRKYNGVAGERLKTVRLRGQLSQGLLLKCGYNLDDDMWSYARPQFEVEQYCVGSDGMCWIYVLEDYTLDDFLNIQKWEPSTPAVLAGRAKGNFPTWIPKTDQERIQNIFRRVQGAGVTFEVTQKLDGSSMTAYVKDGVFGVCSRNLDLKEDTNNAFWAVARELDLETKLRKYGFDIAIQGELVGPAIQGNPEGLTTPMFFMFDVWDGDRYMLPAVRRMFAAEANIPHVPVVDIAARIDDKDVATLLAEADGPSLLPGSKNPVREGFVWKSNVDNRSFKVISNAFLLKTGG